MKEHNVFKDVLKFLTIGERNLKKKHRLFSSWVSINIEIENIKRLLNGSKNLSKYSNL